MAETATKKVKLQSRKVFTEFEKTLLRNLVKKYLTVVENKSTNKVSQNQKDKTWDKITVEFNSDSIVNLRSKQSLKKAWDNLKTRTKEEVSRNYAYCKCCMYIT